MARKKSTTKEGQQRRLPKKPLTKEEFVDELIKHERSKPQVLNEEEFRKHLNDTLLAGFKHGEDILNSVRSTLAEVAAKQSSKVSSKDLSLAIEQIDRSIVAFQFSVLKYNSMWVSTPLRQQSRVILWEPPPVDKRK
jgi:hypothetical protein